mmetsp:Transcript_617/g.1376  ORF Transcript_617/g.1376 Transcript_617/m.1376 type:complete len:259 (-) Transcript_617:111-887(-)|eukprot:CAMPEP_0118926116 /NCGR_PEP_ID=MMETSP1169-20130426/3894_1 /TAXON_ID=36882 /ORGANISM="Pyramimonas obovata, Strain CCMP722" /LENGTH=258 /DNA_ID=CAMNT_0006867607 /DNA_START=145 /DNA_END=921 /DNA_ORIENTATION=+
MRYCWSTTLQLGPSMQVSGASPLVRLREDVCTGQAYGKRASRALHAGTCRSCWSSPSRRREERARGRREVVGRASEPDGLRAIADCVDGLTTSNSNSTEERENWLKWWWDASNARAVEVLIGMAESDSDVDSQDTRGQTKMMLAADQGDFEMVKVLVEHGADVNVTTRKGTTAALIAVWSQDSISLQLLADSGANLSIRDSQFGFTLPMWAVENDDMATLTVLLEAGVDVNEKVLGKTARDMAMQKGNKEACSLLEDA